MEEQVKQPQESVSSENVGGDADYISAIKEMKERVASRDVENEKLKKENAKLLDAYINGGQAQPESTAPQKDISEMRNGLYSQEAIDKGMSNREYIERTLALRDAIISDGGVDPFLPVGKGVPITRDDIDEAEHAATVFRECLDYAQGNDEVFNNELMRRTVDTSGPKRPQNNYYRR